MTKRWLLALLTVVGVVLFVQWFLSAPSLKRDWAIDQANPPEIFFSESEIRVSNVRNFSYIDKNTFEANYEQRAYVPDEIVRVWYVVELLDSFWRGPAHTFLSFEFEGNSFVSVSPEIRRERGETYSPLWGLFRRFELIYIVAEEEDVIQLRTRHRKHRVFLYPMQASKEHAKKLFLDVMQRAKQLTEEPEFYNTLTNSCNTNIVAHVRTIAPKSVPRSFRVLFPGYADSLAFEIGLIDTSLPFEDARRKFLIPENAHVESERPFSLRIRGYQEN